MTPNLTVWNGIWGGGLVTGTIWIPGPVCIIPVYSLILLELQFLRKHRAWQCFSQPAFQGFALKSEWKGLEESRGIEHESCPAAEPFCKAWLGLFGMSCLFLGIRQCCRVAEKVERTDERWEGSMG